MICKSFTHEGQRWERLAKDEQVKLGDLICFTPIRRSPRKKFMEEWVLKDVDSPSWYTNVTVGEHSRYCHLISFYRQRDTRPQRPDNRLRRIRP